MAIRKTLPPREVVQALLDYDPATGVFIWKLRLDSRRWNTRWAGKSAGSFVCNKQRLCIPIGKIRFVAARLAWLHARNELVPDEIDHIDGDPLNNRLANLRAASHSQNLANSTLRKDSSLGIKGITRHRKKYVAQIQHNGIRVRIGNFNTIEEAAKAYRKLAIRLFGEFARWE